MGDQFNFAEPWGSLITCFFLLLNCCLTAHKSVTLQDLMLTENLFLCNVHIDYIQITSTLFYTASLTASSNFYFQAQMNVFKIYYDISKMICTFSVTLCSIIEQLGSGCMPMLVVDQG